MARPKVTEESRQRIAKACMQCQVMKQKCDGQTPCAPCAKKDRAETCAYSAHVRTYGLYRHRKSKKHDRLAFQGPQTRDARKFQADVTPVDSVPCSKSEHDLSPTIEVEIPKLSRTINDNKGRSVYLRDCAALSFLQHIQALIESEGGASPATVDISKVTAMDEGQTQSEEIVLVDGAESLQELRVLIGVFFASTAGVLDIFDCQHVETLLMAWTTQGLVNNPADKAVLFLTLAVAAQARSGGAKDYQRSRYFYHHGRHISLLQLTDEPTLQTVQAFALICSYMIGASHRNGAFLNLGIAISAAKALGFHRNNGGLQDFDKESFLRMRIWKSLSYKDMLFCAMMGRSPSATAIDAAPMDLQYPSEDLYSPDFGQQLALRESARAFAIMHKTVTEIYTKKSVSLGLLQQLAQELQEASANVPSELRTLPDSHLASQQLVLRNATVACSYYFSMMVLSRPFLIAYLQAKVGRHRSGASVDPRVLEKIAQGAMAAIDSAQYTIQLVHQLLMANMLFNNMPHTVAWVLVAALTVCSAYFGRLRSSAESERAIQQADQIFTHYSKHSRQGKNYGLILKKLVNAAIDHLHTVKQRECYSREIRMPQLFKLQVPSRNVAHPNYPITDLDSSRHRMSYPSIRSDGAPAPDAPAGQSIGTGILPHRYQNNDAFVLAAPGQSINMADSISLFELAHSYDSSIESESLMVEGVSGDFFLELENAGDIWDLDWGGTLL